MNTLRQTISKLSTFLGLIGVLALMALGLVGCASAGGGDGRIRLGALPDSGKIEVSEATWRTRLTEVQYRFLREGATEHAFSGAYWNHHEHGVYRCAACGQALYHSRQKFDAGTGWPSFTAALNPEAIDSERAPGFGRARVKISCSRCQSHLGFVYDGGPAPSGLRHSLNSIALVFDGPGANQARKPRLFARR